MRWLVLLLSLAMPVVSWFSQQGVFGPTNGAISDRYPTLIVAAGYAFAIWGLIFLWDMVFGAWQAFSRRAATDPLAGIRPWAAAGFALTAVWMPVFPLHTRSLMAIVLLEPSVISLKPLQRLEPLNTPRVFEFAMFQRLLPELAPGESPMLNA